MLTIVLLLSVLNIGNSKPIELISDEKYVNFRMQNPLLWPSSEPIQYYIESQRFEKWIQAGINFWQTSTCLSFERKYLFLENNGINFFEGDGCSTSFHTEGFDMPFYISLTKDCFNLGTVTHELAHALGFHHEHSRFDRDDYITIGNGNFNFEKFEKSRLDKSVPYDYGSVMHYQQHIGEIRTLDENYQETIGQRRRPSFNDVKKVNMAYCNDICPESLNCRCGGYPNPKNCSKCLCPEGFGGTLCDKVLKRFEECGNPIRKAGGKFHNIQAEGNITCYYMITAAPNMKINFELTESVFTKQTVCDKEYVEINYGKDFSITGARFCNRFPTVSHSETNKLFVIFKGGKEQKSKFRLIFRQVRNEFVSKELKETIIE